MRHIMLFLFAVLVLVSCKEDTAMIEAREVIRPIYAMQVGVQKNLGVRKFPGQAEASDAVTLAFEVSGKLNEIFIFVGDKVKKGDLLASLDSRDFENTLVQAEAELKRSKVQYERMKAAAKDNAVSKQELTNVQAAYENAMASIRIRKKALEDTELRAPYDAIVAAKYIKSFGNVQAKHRAIRLVDIKRIEMVSDIPEDIIMLVKKDMDILVEFDAFPSVIITAKISEIGIEALKTTRTYPVTLIMDQPENVTILPGMAGKAWPPHDTKIDNVPATMKGFDVPLSALLSGDNGQQSFVWVIDPKDGSVSRKDVQTGVLSDSGILIQGLKGGEFIATAGVNTLREGQKVIIIE